MRAFIVPVKGGGMLTRKKHFAAAFLLLSLVLVAAIAVSALAFGENGTATADDSFVAGDSVVFAHLTDTHYYSLAYCGDITENIAEYDAFTQSSTKMVIESTPYNLQALEDIRKEAPDYLFVTGDITLDGEVQGHVEMANLLRQLQNDIRNDEKPGFQVFVIFGNHDMYNPDAVSYHDGTADETIYNVTRADVYRIYSSLGYPDLTDGEIEAFYATLPLYGEVPYDSDTSAVSSRGEQVAYVNSSTANGITMEWKISEENEIAPADTESDYEYGDISAVARLPEGYSVILVDEELSNTVQQHHLGATLFDNTAEWISGMDFGSDTVIALFHHNAVPHFKGEDTLLKDFTIYNYEDTTDFLADEIGVRYVFSGHMHSNDIASRVSLGGNLITDIETSSVTGHRGAVRYARITKGTVGGTYAENFETRLELLSPVDISDMFSDNEYGRTYFDEEYIERFKLGEFVEDGVITDPSTYAATKLFLNIIDNMIYGSYVNVDFIGGLGDMLSGLVGGVDMLKGIPVAVLANNLIDHLEDVVLKDYVYSGTRFADEVAADERGAKLCGYVEELLEKAVNLPMNSAGDTLFDFVMGAYLDHVGGTDRAWADATEAEKEALAGLNDGTTIKALLNILLDKESGLYPIVMGLFDPINLGKDLSESDKTALNGLINMLLGLDIDNFCLNDNATLEKLFGALSLFGIDLGFDLKGMTGKEFIDDILASYVTDALYTSLGEIAHGIVYAFMIDEDAAAENSVGEYALYKADKSLAASFVQGNIDNTPTRERGMLPTQLTVTFGEDPVTTKNFVWFTDEDIQGTQIQYIKGEWDASKATTKDGEFVKYVTTTANIDLGIFATLMQKEVGRHSVSLTGLESGATYSYRVGDAEKGYWSDVYTFTTAPAEGTAFDALLITDIQGSATKPYDTAADILDAIADSGIFPEGYDFVINAGDVVDNSRNWVQWEYFLGSMQDYWANTTQIVANGNHDKYFYEGIDEEDVGKVAENMWIDEDACMDEYNYLQLHYGFSVPEQDTSTGAYFSFDYSSVHFIVLNTNNLNEDGDGLSDDQLEWLLSDLDSTDKKFKVVVMHKSIYSAGSHIDDSDVIGLRAELTPIFAEGGVSIVLSGHDHTYSESYYIDANGNAMEVAADAKTELGTVPGGVLYVSLGTFGDKFYNFRTDDDIPLQFGSDLHVPTLTSPTFGKLSFDGEKLWYYGYQYSEDNGGELKDVYTAAEDLLRGDGPTFEEKMVIIGVAVAAVVVVAAVFVAIARARKR